MVSVETFFMEEGRLAARREWELKNTGTGELIGSATR